jgi:hypothetical protein
MGGHQLVVPAADIGAYTRAFAAVSVLSVSPVGTLRQYCPRQVRWQLTGSQSNAANYPPARHSDPGRYYLGTPGDIISECQGDFVESALLELHSVELTLVPDRD